MFYALLATYMGLQVVDHMTTVNALRKHGMKEANPVMWLLYGKSYAFALAFKLAVSCGIGYGLARYLGTDDIATLIALGGLCAAMAAVCGNNAIQLGRSR